MKNKSYIIIGPPCSGSKLTAKMVAHVLGVKDFNEWEGYGTIESKNKRIIHLSLPFQKPPQYKTINELLEENRGRSIYLIITSRDYTITNLSRSKIYKKITKKQIVEQKQKLLNIIFSINDSSVPYLFWSYETFMLYRYFYLQTLYRFLKVKSDFMPEIKDGNIKYIKI